MPTDLTGTPTSLGIGTYNTSADAPSGLGFNAAMGQIDALIAARATLASPAFTGTPTAPTPATSDNTTKIATTAFVKAQGYLTSSSGVSSFNSRTGAVVPASGDYTAAQVTNAADKASASIQTFSASVSTGPALGGFTGSQTAGTLLNNGASPIRSFMSAATDVAYTLGLTGDTSPNGRFYWNASGQMNWGPGGAANTDTNLYRGTANQLKTDTAFVAGTTINAVSGYQVNGVALGASHLSNGVTGSGAVVLASNASLTNPTLNAATIGDGNNIVLGTTTGTSIGTTAAQKIGFYGVTPVTQAGASGNTTRPATGVTVAHIDDTFSGGIGITNYTIGDIVAALKKLGLIAS